MRAKRRYGPAFASASLLTCFTVFAMVFAAGTARATPLFTDGFESGSLSNWTASSGFTVQQQLVFAGSYAGRATSTGAPAYTYKTLSQTQADLYADVHVNLLSAKGTVQALRFLAADGSGIIG